MRWKKGIKGLIVGVALIFLCIGVRSGTAVEEPTYTPPAYTYEMGIDPARFTKWDGINSAMGFSGELIIALREPAEQGDGVVMVICVPGLGFPYDIIGWTLLRNGVVYHMWIDIPQWEKDRSIHYARVDEMYQPENHKKAQNIFLRMTGVPLPDLNQL